MSIIALSNPELLLATDERGARYAGGDQHWYPKEGFVPPGACGATTASNVLAYLLRSRPALFEAARKGGLGGLAAPDAPVMGKAGYVEFMKQVYRFLYPRAGGLMAGDFLDGIGNLAREYGLPITAERLKAPISRAKRPSFSEAAAFVGASLAEDVPVAFLILSNGCVANLDTWHWVTILALDAEAGRAEIADNGLKFWADIGAWLHTSIMGGSFVRLRV
ncbi:MAG: hypothetical protein LBS91_04040 [Clostridiales Family XIII bacterium]|jgi:hypothetical protein|nr:hypothetical protein [Clostridiales Family XIII bacterium]